MPLGDRTPLIQATEELIAYLDALKASATSERESSDVATTALRSIIEKLEPELNALEFITRTVSAEQTDRLICVSCEGYLSIFHKTCPDHHRVCRRHLLASCPQCHLPLT